MMKNMKKIIALFSMTVMLLALAACGKTGIQSASFDNQGNRDEGSSTVSDRDDKTERDSSASYDSDVDVYDNEDGTYTYVGKIGSKMKTEWFDFTVNDAYQTKEAIGGYTPSDGNVLVVVNLTIKNTFTQSVPMSDWDFQLQWNDDSDDAFQFPVETNEPIIDDQFESEYNLKISQELTGNYVFEAPEGNDDFSVSFLEYFEDDTEGNLYFVYFTADEK